MLFRYQILELFLIVNSFNFISSQIINPKKVLNIHVVILKGDEHNLHPLTKDEQVNLMWTYHKEMRLKMENLSLINFPYIITSSYTWLNVSMDFDLLWSDFCQNILDKTSAFIMVPVNYLRWSLREQEAASVFINLITMFGEHRHVPVISWIPELQREFYEKEIPYLVSFYPMMENYADAFASLLAKSTSPFIFRITCGRPSYPLKKFTEKLATHNTPVENEQQNINNQIHLESESTLEVVEKLAPLIHLENVAIFLNCETIQWNNVIHAANILNITGHKYNWFIVSSVVNFMDSRKDVPENAISMYFKFGDLKFSAKIEMAMERIFDALLYLQNKSIVIDPPKISTCDKLERWENGHLLYKHLLDFQPANEFKIMQFKKDKWEEIGGWSEKKDVYLIKKWLNQTLTLTVEQTQGELLAYERLKVVTKEEEPFVMFRDNILGKACISGVPCFDQPAKKNGKNGKSEDIRRCCIGFLVDLLIILGKELHFSFDLYHVKDGLWGAKVNSTHWNGLVAELKDGNAELAMASLKITKDRQEAIDFSVPVMETGITVMVAKKPGVIPPMAFLEPFDYMSWLTILLFMLHLVALAVFIFEWLSPYGFNRDVSNPRGSKMTFCRSVWRLWALILNNTVPTDNPKGVTSRVMVNVWACFAVVFISSYTANLAAFMIQEIKVEEISGLEDSRFVNPYSRDTPYKFGTVEQGGTDYLIKSKYPSMYSYMKRYNSPSVDSAIEKLRNGSLDAFIYDATALEFRVGNDKGCKLETVGGWSAMTGYGVAFAKGSIWKKSMDDTLIKLMDEGEIHRLRSVWFVGACQRHQKKESQSNPLGISNFMGTIYLLIGGFILSLFIFLVEHVCYNNCQKNICFPKSEICDFFNAGLGRSFNSNYEMTRMSDTPPAERCDNIICNQIILENQKRINQLEKAIERMTLEKIDIGTTKLNRCIRCLAGCNCFKSHDKESDV